jgi:ABC-type ATPase involved in cell division
MENVAFVLDVIGVPPAEVKERTGEVLRRVACGAAVSFVLRSSPGANSSASPLQGLS